MSSVPIPDPVPPPRECVSWKPWRQSQDSDSFLTTSRTESTSSAPENQDLKPAFMWLALSMSQIVCLAKENGEERNRVTKHFAVLRERGGQKLPSLKVSGGCGGNAMTKMDSKLVTHPLCSVPWPSCCRHRTARTQSCPA